MDPRLPQDVRGRITSYEVKGGGTGVGITTSAHEKATTKKREPSEVSVKLGGKKVDMSDSSKGSEGKNTGRIS